MIELQLLQQKIIELLDSGIFKTTAQVVEEFRMENPALWRELELEGEMLYGNSCSSLQQPATRISQVLQDLPAGQIKCQLKNDGYRWSKV